MNKTGKSSGAFIFLIPIILIVTLVVIDTIVSYTNNKTYQKITETIISEVMENERISEDEYSDEIKKAYERNGYETDMLVVDANSYDVYVENEHSYFGIFSSFSNKKSIESEIEIFGVTFKAKKNSVARIKVTAKYNSDEEIEFEYTE